MLYINPKKNELGGYNPPQSTFAAGLVNFPEEFLEEFVKYNGFVNLTIEENTVAAIEPDVEAWDAWKESIPEPGETPGGNDSSGDVVTWDELDAAYNEGVNGAYE